MTRPAPAPSRVPGQVPIQQLEERVLLVTLPAEIHDSLVRALQQDLTATAAVTGARGVVIDLSAVDMVDSYLGRALVEIAAATRLMAARPVLAGIRPAVAITLAELGLTLPGLAKAASVPGALALLRAPRPARSGTPS